MCRPSPPHATPTCMPGIPILFHCGWHTCLLSTACAVWQMLVASVILLLLCVCVGPLASSPSWIHHHRDINQRINGLKE